MPKWRGMLRRMPRAGAHEGEIRGMKTNFEKELQAHEEDGWIPAFAIRTYLLGAYEMTVLFNIYFILAIVGIIRWNQKAKNTNEGEMIG